MTGTVGDFCGSSDDLVADVGGERLQQGVERGVGQRGGVPGQGRQAVVCGGEQHRHLAAVHRRAGAQAVDVGQLLPDGSRPGPARRAQGAVETDRGSVAQRPGSGEIEQVQWASRLPDL